MGKCGACGYSHPHPGEKNCRFTKDAKEKCKDAGIEDSRWGEFLDVDTLQELTKSEGDDTGLASYLTVDDLKLLQQSDKDQKDQLFKLQKDVTKLTSQLGSFLSIHGPPVRAPAATAPLAVSTTVGSLTSTVPTTTVAVCMAGGGGDSCHDDTLSFIPSHDGRIDKLLKSNWYGSRRCMGRAYVDGLWRTNSTITHLWWRAAHPCSSLLLVWTTYNGSTESGEQ